MGLCGILRDVTERKELDSLDKGDGTGYTSEIMKANLKQVLLAAESDSTVLFLGESGSGKDFLARFLHDHSRRSGGPFFAINCAALAPQLVESELFGHEPGSFTGSRGRKRGTRGVGGGRNVAPERGRRACLAHSSETAHLFGYEATHPSRCREGG